MAYPVATLPDGRIKMSDGTIQAAPNSFNAGSAVSTTTPNQPTSPQLPQVVKNFVGLSDPITNAPQGLAPSSAYESAPQEMPQPSAGQPSQTQQAPEIIHQITSDIIAGMKPTEIAKYYPEFEGADTSIFSELSSDIEAGMPIEEAPKFYPEIFPQEAQKNWVNDASQREGFMQNTTGFMSDLTGAATAEVPSAIGDSLSFLGKAGLYNPANLLVTATRALFSDKTYDELRDDQKKEVEKLAELGNAASEIFKKNSDYDKSSAGASIGTFGTDVGTSLVGPNKLGILKEGTGIITKGAGFVKNALNLAGDGALQGAKYGVTTSDGKDIPEALPDIALEAGYGAAGNLILGGIVKTYGGIKNAPENYKNLKTYLSGLEPREITAIEKASPDKIDDVLRNAQESVGQQGDYLQTPYHKGAEEAQKTLDMIDTNLSSKQAERMAMLEDVPVEKISLEAPREKLKSSLKALNIEDIRMEDGSPVITPVSGREVLVDFNNSADAKALAKLNEILADDVSPVQTMDRIKKLQEWIYENKSTIGIKGTSAKMESLISKVQGSMNDTFKKQLPGEYKKIMTSLADDIKLKDDIQRLFGIADDGKLVGNRGELVMKRLTSGTTTGGESRNLAMKIMDKYGVDLIQEARLRQIAMDLVGDARGQTLFGVIKGGKQGIIDKAIEYTAGKLVNKEKVIRNLAKGAKTTPKVQEPLYPKNLREKLKASKKAQETEKVRAQAEREAKRASEKTAQERLLASRVPGGMKTTVETPMNPKGNESKVLAGKQGVMVDDKKVDLLPERTLTSQKESARKLESIKSEIASNTHAARYRGTGNERVESAIQSKLSKGEITKDDALAILEDAKTNPKYSYMDYKKLDSFIEEIKSEKKIQSFEEMIAKSPEPEASTKQTHKDIYDKLQKIANDGRYGEKSWNDLAEEFKKKTGKDIEDTSFQDFGDDGMIKKEPTTAKEKLVASRKSKARPTEQAKNAIQKEEKYRVAEDMNRTNLTTKILKGLGDRETVSKEFIRNMTNSGDVKQVEKDIIRNLLDSEGDKVNVADFKKKVQAELLPLKVRGSLSKEEKQIFKNAEQERAYVFSELNKRNGGNNPRMIDADLSERLEAANKILHDLDPGYFGGESTRYENISLPSGLRGKVRDYKENIYESPIETNAGNTHFTSDVKNYFGHTRIEEMADNTTRRVIEVQSDLFQKGHLESEIGGKQYDKLREFIRSDEMPIFKIGDKISATTSEGRTMKGKVVETSDDKSYVRIVDEMGETHGFSTLLVDDPRIQSKIAEFEKNNPANKLRQYNDPTAHFRMIREEVSKAVEDGKTKLQFPTGETAMKIEGLGQEKRWFTDVEKPNGFLEDLTPDKLEVGKKVHDGINKTGWIITDVLGDGKFKAIEKPMLRELENSGRLSQKDTYTETFDISGKADQNNPIYKFYEKEVGRYLKNKYDAKLVTDDKGVSWYQVDVKYSMGGPVEAFRAGKNITQNLSPEQVKEVKALNKKLFGDDNVKITESILSNHEALGSYKDGMIKIVNGQANPKDTYLHEAVHKYLDIFMDEAEHTDILKYASEKYGIDDFVAVEEKLAEDFIKYTKDRAGFIGKMKTYFESFLSRIKAYFGNADKIDDLYRDISGGKANVQKPKTAIERFRENRVDAKDTSGKDLLERVNSAYIDTLKTPDERNLGYAELSKGTPIYEIQVMIEKMRKTPLKTDGKNVKVSIEKDTSGKELLEKINSAFLAGIKNPEDRNLVLAEMSKKTPTHEIMAMLKKPKSAIEKFREMKVYRGTIKDEPASYAGTKKPGQYNLYGRGKYFSSSKDVAQSYADFRKEKTGLPTKVISKKVEDSLFVDLRNPSDDLQKFMESKFQGEEYKRELDRLKKEGVKEFVKYTGQYMNLPAFRLEEYAKANGKIGTMFDDFENPKEANFVVYNFGENKLPRTLLPKKEGVEMTEPLMEEAKKYKSAEEFISEKGYTFTDKNFDTKVALYNAMKKADFNDWDNVYDELRSLGITTNNLELAKEILKKDIDFGNSLMKKAKELKQIFEQAHKSKTAKERLLASRKG